MPALPIRSHAARIPSGERGLSLSMLRGIRDFYRERGGLSKMMADVCKEDGFGASVCTLTRATGLSLAESLVIVSGAEAARGLVGTATSFFSYSWTGTRLGDMLDAIERTLVELERADGVTRYVWIDMFCASQNLLAGVFRDPNITREADPAGYRARKEDTDRIFDDALEAVGELLFYCSPLVGTWTAPAHSYLLPTRGEQ